MSSRLRSSSLGAVPRQKSLARSRAQSSAASPLEVRCACQFFQSDSLIPERINPIGSRPPSRVDGSNDNKPIFCSKHNIFESDVLLEESDQLNFDKSFNYAEARYENKENRPPLFDQVSSHSEIPSFSSPPPPPPQLLNFIVDRPPQQSPIEIETFKADFVPIIAANNLNNSSQVEQTNDLTHRPYPMNATAMMMRGQQFSSQKSLDRYSSSTLLAKYRLKSQSHAPSLQGSAADIRVFPRMTKTVSFDYGKPTSSNSTSQLNTNPNYDQYHRMSPMVFPVRERLQRMERMSVQRDHEYEPIGEPIQSENDDEVAMCESNINEGNIKRPIDTIEGNGQKNKLLRTPTEDSEDNISAQDFQDQIENRFFFRKEIEPISDNDDLPHPEITVEEAIIIDEEPIQREIPKDKKKGFLESAQKSSMTFHKKIKAQASSLKTSLNNKMKKKQKEKPVACEISEIGDEEEKENFESIKINVQNVDEETAKATKQSKMSMLKMNIKKPTLPKFKKPHFNKPDFSSLKRLGRSKSMKEESSNITGGDESSSLHSPEVATADPSPRKKFDFGTYPRMIRDKFKRSKLPERSDRSMVSDSPAADEDFNRISSTFAQRGPVASRWPEYAAEEESGKYQHFDSETDLERDRLEFDETRNVLTEEQRQLNDMDRENLQIHLMAKQEKFRKPYVQRQESDVASEEDKLMWSGMLNQSQSAKQPSEQMEDFEENALHYKYELDAYPNDELLRSSTPKSNQETQSSGSSGTRRRRGYLDDDDEEYFIRDQKISSGYIDSAIKEGLSSPENNALTQLDTDNREFLPEKPTRSLKRKKKQVEPQEEEQKFNSYFKTYPPHRPTRKQKSLSIEPNDEEEIIIEDQMIPDDTSDIIDERDMATFKGIEHPDLAYLHEDYDNDMDYNINNMPVPPTPPRRRKKKIRSMLQQQHIFLKNEKPQNDDVIVYRQEHQFVPMAQEEHFTTPTPTPRTRSRSQMSSYTLDDADSFIKDSNEGFAIINISENKENNKDYATVRKEHPSRPVRRKRSTKSLGDRQFATLPLLPKRSDHDLQVPPRPPRNYSTISSTLPNKPPRRKSAGSLVEISKTIKDDDYEEILDVNDRLSQRLQSGAVMNKMKDRPLPPPPRPKRENKKSKKDTPPADDESKFDKDDKDGGAERIQTLSIDIVDHALPATEDIEKEIQQRLGEVKDEENQQTSYLPRQDSDFSEPERPLEVEVSTQTDPVPDEEYALEDEEGDLEEYISSDGKVKTLEDILKEEQEAEMERARQLAEAENLARGIQRFRESSQRSFSERSNRSRPITPSAVVVEMRKESPIVFEKQEQIMTEAGLFIHPITYDDYGIPLEEDTQDLQPPPPSENLDVNNNLNNEQVVEEIPIEESTEIVNTSTSPEPDITEILRRAQQYVDAGNDDDDEELDAEMQRKIEEMIESVMSSAKEEADWLRKSQENVTEEQEKDQQEEEQEQQEEIVEKVEVREIEEAPLPPPRRKLTAEEAPLNEDEEPSIKIDTHDTTDDLQLEESQAVSEERPSSPFPSRLHLTSLEIDNLSVTQLQAGRISASEIDSNTIVTNEFECKLSSTMPNSGATIEIPPGLIDEIVERVRSAERAEQQEKIAEEPPVRPPLPSQYQPLSSQPPSTFYQLKDYSEDDQQQQPHLPAPHRRRKHHQQKQRKESTSEEDYHKDQRPRSRAGNTSSNDQSVLTLGGQFLRACGNSIIDTGNQLMEILRAASKDEQSRDLHIALIILIIIVAGLFLMSMGEKAVHHHHWDFFNPGENR